MTVDQGYLDRLCSVYSVINAITLIARNSGEKLMEEQLEALFKILSKVLHDEEILFDALNNGLSIKPMRRLIKAASNYCLNNFGFEVHNKLTFKEKPRCLKIYWSKLLEHFDDWGEGTIILRMSGRHNHWTCLKKITNKRISLDDSDGLNRLDYSKCTIGRPTINRIHCLWPTQTILLMPQLNV